MSTISQLAFDEMSSSLRPLERGQATGAPSVRSKSTKDFEAMFLRQTLESILPSGADAVFGTGTAGGVWRSMLADHVSAVLAERGVLSLLPSSISGAPANPKGEQN